MSGETAMLFFREWLNRGMRLAVPAIASAGLLGPLLCLASVDANAADPRADLMFEARPAQRSMILGEEQTADYIIYKLLQNFKYHGYDELGEWTMHNPIISYRRPFFDISVVKQLRISGEPDEQFTLVFRIDLTQVKASQIERGVFHVICISRCIEVSSNGNSGAYDYFWINAITITNPIDGARVNNAFRHLLNFYPVHPEPFDSSPGLR